MLTNPKDIKTKNDLIKFIKSLAKEASIDSENWANKDLPSFLEAMAAWVEDMEGYYKNQEELTPVHPSWKTIGEILKASTIYE